MDLDFKHKEEEREKPSYLAMVVLLGIIGFFLSVEAKAADVEDVSPEQRTLPLNRGSLVEINDDLDFSLSREKRYCDGQDAGFFRSLMSTDCCVIRIHSLQVSNTSQIVMKRGIRAIVEIPEKADYALIESKYPTSISCGDKAPTVTSLEKAMGSRVRVHKVEGPVKVAAPSVERYEGLAGTESLTTPKEPMTTDLGPISSQPVAVAPQPLLEENPFKVDEI